MRLKKPIIAKRFASERCDWSRIMHDIVFFQEQPKMFVVTDRHSRPGLTDEGDYDID